MGKYIKVNDPMGLKADGLRELEILSRVIDDFVELPRKPLEARTELIYWGRGMCPSIVETHHGGLQLILEPI